MPYVVKRSSVARHVRLEIKDEAGLTVIIPKNCELDTVDEVLRSKSRWILNKMDRYTQMAQVLEKGNLSFGDTVPYLGRELRVISCQGIGSCRMIELRGQTLLVHGNGESPDLDFMLERWYRGQAAKILKQKIDLFAGSLGLGYKKLVIRGQKTRWASCSHNGTLSFNWRLIMAPEPVVDYVVIHEVTHLKEMNHTKRFWAIVAEHCHTWRQEKKWLNDHGLELAAILNSSH